MKKLLNDILVDMTQEEIAEIEAFENSRENKELKISALKQELANTDYIACKIAEGEATKEEYAEVINKRKQWRIEINNLENEVNANASN